jgi:porin
VALVLARASAKKSLKKFRRVAVTGDGSCHFMLRPLFTFVAFAASCASACLASDSWATGVDLTVDGSQVLSGTASGGEALHGAAIAHAEWTSPTSTEAATGAPKHRFYVSALALTGRGPTGRSLGDFFGASNIEGHESARLYSWWFETARGAWSLRAGALLADDEFAGTDVGGNFLNSAFGWPAFISANTVNTGPAFYVAAPGLRLDYTWNETTTWRAGIFDGDSFDSPTGDPEITRHGLHYELGGDQGWFAITELTFAGPGAVQFKTGLWLHTATFADVRDDAQGQPIALSGASPAEHNLNYGFYASVEKTLTGQAGEPGHVAAYFRTGLSPADRNALGWAFDTGLAWTGPCPRRPQDVLALGLTHARFSSHFSDHARLTDPATPAPDFEHAVELTYTFILSERCSVQPDLQYIRHPGGSLAQRDALIFLTRFTATF